MGLSNKGKGSLVHLQLPKTAHHSGIEVANVISSEISRILGDLDLHVVQSEDCRPALEQLLLELGYHVGNGNGASILLRQDSGINLGLQDVNIFVDLLKEEIK